MKRIYSIIFFVLCISILKGQKLPTDNETMANYNMNTSTVVISCGSHTFKDSGGNANYANSENFTMTFSVASGCLSFSFTSFSTESCCDRLRIFDGPSGASPLIGTYQGLVSPGVVNASGSSITFSFTSDGSVVDAGWAADIICTPLCSGAPVAGSAVASPSLACGTFTSNLTVTGAGLGCGLTYQWQRATILAGPYTNIVGATNPTANVSSSVTSYYRRVTACGASTVASAVATASISAAGCGGLCAINSIASLPFNSGAQTTCGQGNDVTSGNVTNICGSSLYYGGEDVVYSFTPAVSGVIQLSVSLGSSFMGMTLYQNCPTAGGTCVGAAQSGAGTQSLCAGVTAGQVYYVVIDSWPSPNCNPYLLTITAPGPCVGSVAGSMATANPTTACGTLNTTLTLSGVTACGPTFQWQSAPALAGPYTNIVGATNTVLAQSINVSTFYRVLLTCGASTAVSTIAQTSVSSFTPPPCSLSSYAGTPATFSLDVFVGSLAPTTDDALWPGVAPIGFPFCFAGQQMTGGYIGSNSVFVFDGITCFPNIYPWSFAVYAAAGVATGWSISMPAPTVLDYTPRNAILAPWQDLMPPSGGVVRYGTLGVAPNRRFVVSYENVALYSCTSMSFTGQIKLFETSNVIEIHIANKPICSTWNAGQAILGLQNYDGTIYIPAVNPVIHNAPVQWAMTNQAFHFISTCPSQSICGVVLPVEVKSFYGENSDKINKLFWETSKEENIKEFILERSIDATNFTEIGSINSKNKPSLHQYNDNTYERGFINYYRLTSVDNNGVRSKSSIYPIRDIEDPIVIVSIFPNPATDKLSVELQGKNLKNTDVNFVVYDQLGRVVLKQSESIKIGMNNPSLNIESLEKGVYFIEISTADRSMVSKQKFTKL